ncbi:uncharacterized protein TNCT_462591 [Trichonephila clavata]|uniref:Uncharacterized protein n=1 Tax=Trichonephila clavata TaxID=2740835 RepID=A0A8X6GET0_TRICU|nr:uncharacterized protein TNCT_462591 [Trichonephila clavata]
MAKKDPLVRHPVSLLEINCSQDEMSYITRMRNAIKFQTANREDYQYLNFNFVHLVVCPSSTTAKLETCLRHSFCKVMKSLVLVHNYTPFLQWTLIAIDNDGFPGERNLGQLQELIQRNDEYEQTELYLIANFGKAHRFSTDSGWICWNLLQRQLLRNTALSDLQIINVDILRSMHTSGWRRVFAENFIDFSCADTDIAAYLREQTECRPIHVFKEISKREMGETFNNFRILESIASPYYFTLPHRSTTTRNEMNNISDDSSINVPDDPPTEKEVFLFESKLRIARKI